MKILVLLIIMCSFFPLTAQVNIEKIDLNKYITTDYNYKSFDVLAGYGGNSSFDKRKSNDKENFYSWQNANALSIRGNYHTIKNDRKTQSARTISFITNPYYSFGKNEDGKKVNGFKMHNNLSVQLRTRSYRSNKFFFHKEFNFEIDQDYKNYNLDENDSHITDASINTPLMIGWGRVEIVSNAWRAYRILQDLNKYNLLEVGANFDEASIFEIADYITNRNFTRAFDSREKFKEDMVGLTNKYFIDKAKISDPLYYASLYDMWRYSVNSIRRTGSSFSIGLNPELYFDYNVEKKYNNNNKSAKLNISIIATYEKYKALNLKWQFDFVSSIKTGLTNLWYYDNDNTESNVVPFIFPSIKIGVGYYPNTRTGFNSNLSLYDSFRLHNVDSKIKTNSFGFSFRNSLYYYISPKLRLNAFFDINTGAYNFDSIDNYTRRTHLRFRYGIKYSLYIF